MRLNGVSSNVSLLLHQIPPQGCVLFPLSFHCYVNECQTHHDRHRIIKFTDDSVLASLLSRDDSNDCRLQINPPPPGDNKGTLKRLLLQVDKMDQQDFRADVFAIPAALHGNKGLSQYPGVVTAAYSPHLFHGSGGGKKKFQSLARLRREPSRVGTEPSCPNMDKKTQLCHRFEIKNTQKKNTQIAFRYVDRCVSLL